MATLKTRNMNLLFNKLYYTQLNQADFGKSVDDANRDLCNMRFDYRRDFRALYAGADKAAMNTFVPDPSASYHTLHMKTMYPGMLIGIGLPHGSRQCDQDISFGFSFDYVSGQPHIPGSTVKGVLRSAFSTYPEAVVTFLNEDASDEAESWTVEDVVALESRIFDGADSFLDAVLFDSDASGYVLSLDTLAPHGDDPTKSPDVLSILKIRPNVYFEFRFILKESSVAGKTLSADQKASLFSKLLCTFGIGAKTNVGYGVLEQDEAHDPTKKVVVTKQFTAPNKPEYRICSKCGARNYKYRKDTDQVNWNWEKNICFKKECRGTLK